MALGRRYGCTAAGLRIGRPSDRAALAACCVAVNRHTDTRDENEPTTSVVEQTDRIGITIGDLMQRADALASVANNKTYEDCRGGYSIFKKRTYFLRGGRWGENPDRFLLLYEWSFKWYDLMV